MGYQVIAISPDKPEKMANTMDKKKLTYTLLSDSDMKASMAFGIAFVEDAVRLRLVLESYSGEDHHMLPVPSVFIVGTDGVIDFVYSNPDYKVRLQPDALLKAAREAMKE